MYSQITGIVNDGACRSRNTKCNENMIMIISNQRERMLDKMSEWILLLTQSYTLKISQRLRLAMQQHK